MNIYLWFSDIQRQHLEVEAIVFIKLPTRARKMDKVLET